MLKSKYSYALGAIVVMGATLPVAAATATFNLQKTNSYVTGGGDAGARVGNTLSMSNNGIDATFTGLTIADAIFDGGGVISGATVSDAQKVHRYNNGLGVKANGGDRHHTVDAIGDIELIEMSFADADGAVNVQLSELVFGWVGGPSSGFNACRGGSSCYGRTNGAFEIILDTVDGGIGNGDTSVLQDVVTGVTSRNYGNGVSKGAFDVDPYAFVDDTFGVMAGTQGGLSGSWKLLSVTVSTVASIEEPPIQIPLPATALILLSGLAGLTMVRRKT